MALAISGAPYRPVPQSPSTAMRPRSGNDCGRFVEGPQHRVRHRVPQLRPCHRGPPEPVPRVELRLETSGRQRFELQVGGLTGSDHALEPRGGAVLSGDQHVRASLILRVAELLENVPHGRHDGRSLDRRHLSVRVGRFGDIWNGLVAGQDFLHFAEGDDDRLFGVSRLHTILRFGCEWRAVRVGTIREVERGVTRVFACSASLPAQQVVADGHL